MSRKLPAPMARDRGNAPQWFESLEIRNLLSAAYPTDLEQYMLELINRARANPAAEAARVGTTLNEGLPAGTISAAAKQPLAINPNLHSGARQQSQWMIDKDIFSHTGAYGSDPQSRMKSAGYVFAAPWTWAENIALRTYKTAIPTSALVDAMESDLFVDVGISDRGHRVNLLDPASREVGVGMSYGMFNGVNAATFTEDFASSGSAVYLTGVAYTDAKVKDHFYTPGEGLNKVNITATRVGDGATFTTRTWISGGYTLELAPGVYTITASSTALGTVTYNSVTVGYENVKRDFTPSATAPVPTPTPTPTPTPIPTPKPTPTPTPKPTPTPPKTTPTPPKTNPTDTKPPRAPVFSAVRKRKASRYYGFTITYTDAGKIKRSSIGDGDIQVRGPHGFARNAVFVSSNKGADSTSLTVTYAVKGPDRHWDRVDNGEYTLWINAGQVKDAAGNALPAQQIGSFNVLIPKAGVAAPAPGAVKAAKKSQSIFG